MSNREPHAATQSHADRAMGMRGCEAHTECSSERPGHGVGRIQARLAEATPSKWVDAIVLAADVDGFVTIADLDGGIRRLWHHAPTEVALAAGDPVAWHSVYGVLAHGVVRVNVADA